MKNHQQRAAAGQPHDHGMTTQRDITWQDKTPEVEADADQQIAVLCARSNTNKQANNTHCQKI